MDPLLESLGRIRRRLLALRAVEAGLMGAMAAAPPAALFTLMRIFMPERVPLSAAWPILPLVLLPCGFVLGAVWQLVRGVSMHEAAMTADRAAGLQERLTTAVEVISPSLRGTLGTPRYPAASAAGSRQGLLDARLLDQARTAAAKIDVTQLRLARSMPRTARIVAVAALVLAAAALVPSVGGPAVPQRVAAKAVEALHQVATKESLALSIRAALDKAAAALAAGNVSQSQADRATAGILDTINRQAAARREIGAALDAANPDLKEMMDKVAHGNMDGARKSAERLGIKLQESSGAGGPTDEHKKVAAGLAGAAQVARQKDLPRLAAELEKAAEAVRRSQPDLAKTLADLASQMTESLRPPSAEDVAVVAQVRTALGHSLPVVTGTTASPVVAPTPTGPAAIVAADSPAIHPEDRDIVRRYFGGEPAARGW
jgi:hypothetical protein